MISTVFRKYDIRGKVGTEFVLENVYELAQAIVKYYVDREPSVKRIAVGMDGREHSENIKKEICRAVVDSGLEAVFVGLCPTPVVGFALHNDYADAGIMITASHNGKEYNGLKLDVGKGCVCGDNIQE